MSRLTSTLVALTLGIGLPTAVPSFPAPPDPPDGLAADPPREWSYEPLLDDLPVAAPVLG